MTIKYLVFDTEAAALTKQSALDSSLGFPISGGISQHAYRIIAHPSNGKYALQICSCYSTSDADAGLENQEVCPCAENLLTSDEIAALKTQADMVTDGWFTNTE